MPQTLFANIGLFWRADNVFWGRPNNEGRLLGIPARNRSAPAVDFREQEGIYVLYAGYDSVYVGGTTESAGLLKRLNLHQSDDLADRWDRFSWFGLRKVNAASSTLGISVDTKHVERAELLDHIESILVHAMEPPLNRYDGFAEDVDRYLQQRDERLGPTTDEMIEQLWRSNVSP